MPATTDALPGRLRRALRSEVLSHVRSQGASSRAQLERDLGMSRALTTSVVDQLLTEGVLLELPGVAGAGRGRPSRRLVPSVPSGSIVGLDLGHDHIAVAVASMDLTVHAEQRVPFPVDADSAGALDAAADLVAHVLREAGVEPTAVHTCVTGLPGPLDSSRRSVASPTILANWAGLDVGEELGHRMGLPVSVDNDANLGAIAEHLFGAAQGRDDFIYVKASGGVGAGVVLGGSLVYGSTGAAGEIGHTQITPDGNWCRCGNRGCLETVVSVDQLLQQIAHLYPADYPLRTSLPDIAAHPVARKVFAESGRVLGLVLANLCALLDPAAVVIGGELAQASTEFVDGVRESINRLAQPGFDGRVAVTPGALGVRAELLGCLILARDTSLEALDS